MVATVPEPREPRGQLAEAPELAAERKRAPHILWWLWAPSLTVGEVSQTQQTTLELRGKGRLLLGARKHTQQGREKTLPKHRRSRSHLSPRVLAFLRVPPGSLHPPNLGFVSLNTQAKQVPMWLPQAGRPSLGEKKVHQASVLSCKTLVLGQEGGNHLRISPSYYCGPPPCLSPVRKTF